MKSKNSSHDVRIASPVIIDMTNDIPVIHTQAIIDIHCTVSDLLGERHAPLSVYSLPLQWSEKVVFTISPFTTELANTVWLSTPIVIESSTVSGEKYFFLKKEA
ncbi:MAG TPA: hypothetical protein PLK40_07190 [Bacteroidaceae bacterium]|nr:hypothetical protein [Bacteroidaceae bacterium]